MTLFIIYIYIYMEGRQISGFGWVCGRDIPSRGPNSALKVSIGSLTMLPSKKYFFFFLGKKNFLYLLSNFL